MKIEWTGPVTRFSGLTINITPTDTGSVNGKPQSQWVAIIVEDIRQAHMVESWHSTENEAREWAARFIERISSGAVKQAIAAEREAFIDAIYAERERCRQGGDPEGDGALRLFEQRLRAQWGEGG